MSNINESGGVVYQVDPWTLLQRFLILGDETGDYHVSAKTLEIENLRNVERCWSLDSKRTLSMIQSISTTGRAVNNNTCLAALAWGFIHPDVEIRRDAAAALPLIARTLSHLITFVDYVTRMRGWGRLLKRAVAGWFQDKPTSMLGYQLIKYQNRKGWRSGDLLRLSHPTPADKAHDVAYFWATGGDPYQIRQDWFEALPEHLTSVLRLREMMTQGVSNSLIVAHIVQHKLPWEIIPSELLNNALLWVHMYPTMPNEAFLRNLTRMGAMGLMNSGSNYTSTIVAKIAGMKNVHPMQFIIALVAYRRGAALHAGNPHFWYVNRAIVTALEIAAFSAFESTPPTGKRIVLAIDRSGSMKRSMVQHIPDFSSVEAATALAGLIVSREEHKIVLGFNRTAERMPKLEKFTTLSQYAEVVRGLADGGTNCAAPIDYCIQNNVDPDAIIILTDAQHWEGPLPDVALRELRERVQHPVKVVVVCTTPNKWTVVCPGDPDVMNIVGFDSHALRLVHDFLNDDPSALYGAAEAEDE